MEKIKSVIAKPILATIISLGIMLVSSIIVLKANHHGIEVDTTIKEIFFPALVFIVVINVIFSYVFFYLNKKWRILLYFLIFLIVVWAIFFFKSYYGYHKSENKIPDNMEELSEWITSIIIYFILINIISNFITLLIIYRKEILKRKNK
jgi:cell division protein FtsW (lipid II flippase)